MSRMDEEQAILKQLPLSDFKMWSSTALKTFSSYGIVMGRNRDNIRISRMYFCCLRC